jgi:photosynthetic reaction center M subunit
MVIARVSANLSSITGLARLAMLNRAPFISGGLGIASLMCGLIAFVTIGFNMLASVNYDPVQFIRQLFWLALEPPRPKLWLAKCRP